MKKRYLKILNIKTINILAQYLKVDYIEIISLAANPKYSNFKIKKKNGGYRLILAPSSVHKDIQRRINYVLQSVYFFNDPGCVYGFNKFKKEHIKSNAQNHINKKFLLNIDIKDFFPSITSKMVRDMFMSAPFNYNEKTATLLAMLTTYKNMLPTGAPSSPIISNLIFVNADKKLIELSKKYNLTYTRYADDLSFSSNHPITEDMIKEINLIIEFFEFKLNPKKYRLLKHYNRQTVTGITVNEKVNVNRKYIRNIRAILHNIENEGLEHASMRYFNLSNIDTNYISKMKYSIKGKIEFIGFVRGKSDHIYNGFIEKLNNLYKNEIQHSSNFIDEGANKKDFKDNPF